MTTLVIHPKDPSTDFLSEIYEGKDWTIINDPVVSKRFLVNAIKNHDRIIMLGHGTEYGMISKTNNDHYHFVIDPRVIYLLREKLCVGIWCNADVFFKKYNLKGFYTGMIVSEYEEALQYCVSCYYSDIDKSNALFAEAARYSIDSSDPLLKMKALYIDDDNNVVNFNKHNLFQKY